MNDTYTISKLDTAFRRLVQKEIGLLSRNVINQIEFSDNVVNLNADYQKEFARIMRIGMVENK